MKAGHSVGWTLLWLMCLSFMTCFRTNADAGNTSDLPGKMDLSPFSLPTFYRKCVRAGGLPVVSSERVSDYALREAAWLIDRMLENRDDIRQALIANKVRFTVMAVDEFTTDIPEHNSVNTREELKTYDPDLARLLAEVFGATEWRYIKPEQRSDCVHLRGFDRTKAPRFVWPKHVERRYHAFQAMAHGKSIRDADGFWQEAEPLPIERLADVRSGPATTASLLLFVNRCLARPSAATT